MAPKKKIAGYIKLQIPAGQATPAPPVGPALGAKGVNIMQFTKTPPAAVLIKEALGLSSGSGEPHVTKVGELSKDQLRSIAELKLPDLNANDVEAAMKVIQGTARSMGVRVEGVRDTGVYTRGKKKGRPDAGPVVEEAVAAEAVADAEESAPVAEAEEAVAV